VDFKKLVFAKNAVNKYGQFIKGDRAQGRFPQELTDSYIAHGILRSVEEPVALTGPHQSYKPPRKPKA